MTTTRTRFVTARRPKDEMAKVFFDDLAYPEYLFFNLALAICAAHDEGDTDIVWTSLLNDAMKVLKRRNFAKLKQVIYDIDRQYNNAQCAVAEAARMTKLY